MCVQWGSSSGTSQLHALVNLEGTEVHFQDYRTQDIVRMLRQFDYQKLSGRNSMHFWITQSFCISSHSLCCNGKTVPGPDQVYLSSRERERRVPETEMNICCLKNKSINSQTPFHKNKNKQKMHKIMHCNILNSLE